MPIKQEKRRALFKAVLLVLFIAGALIAVRFTPLKEFVSAQRIGRFLESAGFWAPLAFIVIYAGGVCLFLPGTVLAAIGAAAFGPYWGFAWVWMGALIGASIAFVIGRYLGRDFAASLIGDRLQKYDQAIARNGFATVLYLRLIYFPFTPMNFGMGLTRVSFGEYVAGTALGILVGTFLFTFFFGTVKEIWASGRWADLLSGKVVFSLAMFVLSFWIPKIVKKIRAFNVSST
jgi:uncharacterized membrane protein YdjX (TVP38/TMEM64 family)